MEQTKQERFAQLYQQNYSALYRFAACAISNRDFAQDLVQETFLVGQMKLDALLASENPRGWLFRTLKNLIGNAYQKQRFILSELLPDAQWDQSANLVLSVSDLYAGLIEPDALTLLVWIYCQGLSYQEAADRLGITLSACKKRIQRAKEALRAAIEKNNLL